MYSSQPLENVMCQTLYSSDYRKNAVLLPSLLRNAIFMDNSESLYLPKRIEFILLFTDYCGLKVCVT